MSEALIYAGDTLSGFFFYCNQRRGQGLLVIMQHGKVAPWKAAQKQGYKIGNDFLKLYLTQVPIMTSSERGENALRGVAPHAQKENARRALAVRSAYAYDHSLGSRRRSLRRDCGLRYPRWRGRGASSVLCVTLYM